MSSFNLYKNRLQSQLFTHKGTETEGDVEGDKKMFILTVCIKGKYKAECFEDWVGLTPAVCPSRISHEHKSVDTHIWLLDISWLLLALYTPLGWFSHDFGTWLNPSLSKKSISEISKALMVGDKVWLAVIVSVQWGWNQDCNSVKFLTPK